VLTNSVVFPTPSVCRLLTSSTTYTSASLSFYNLRFHLIWYISEKDPFKLTTNNLFLFTLYFLYLFLSLTPFSPLSHYILSLSKVSCYIVQHYQGKQTHARRLRCKIVPQYFPSSRPIKYCICQHFTRHQIVKSYVNAYSSSFITFLHLRNKHLDSREYKQLTGHYFEKE
jgi:hypothetical protein